MLKKFNYVEWYAKNRLKRLKYWRDRYKNSLEVRERQKAKALQWHRDNVERSRTIQKLYRERERMPIKVARNMDIPVPKARQLLAELGT